jgi:hypothetical protein
MLFLFALFHFNVAMATAQFRFDTPQLAAGSFIFHSIFLHGWCKNRLRIKRTYSNECAKKHYTGNIG